MNLATRHRQPEWMDAPDADPAELRRSLAFIRRVNALLGYTRSTLRHLERFSRRWRPDEKITILDLATGSADVPLEILRWADRVNRRRGWRWDVRIVAVDLHADTLSAAAEHVAGEEAGRVREGRPRMGPRPESGSEGPGVTGREVASRRLRLVRADALHLPFPDGAFDYAITSMFLHHLDDAVAARVLAGMNRVARRGVIVADLLRHRRAYAWISLLTLACNPMVRHDARVSVAQAFTRTEVLRLRDAAGLGFACYRRHFGHRFVLAGEKDETRADDRHDRRDRHG